MNYISKCFKHLKLILKHKYFVFIVSCQIGIPIRGIFHDMSKFSPSEFFTSAKYYNGSKSPIDIEKEIHGFSYAWLHHRGHNKHHWEYWIDNLSHGGDALKIPYKYVLEMLCDWIGSGKAYNGKDWTIQVPFKFFINKYNKGDIKIHLETYKFIFNVLYEYSKTGKLKKSINKYKNEYFN